MVMEQAGVGRYIKPGIGKGSRGWRWSTQATGWRKQGYSLQRARGKHDGSVRETTPKERGREKKKTLE